MFLSAAATWAGFDSSDSSDSASEAPLHQDPNHEATGPKRSLRLGWQVNIQRRKAQSPEALDINNNAKSFFLDGLSHFSVVFAHFLAVLTDFSTLIKFWRIQKADLASKKKDSRGPASQYNTLMQHLASFLLHFDCAPLFSLHRFPGMSSELV